MARTILAAIVAMMLIAVSQADARSSHSGKVYAFRTGTCKTSNCYSKHPSGRYVHPLTDRKR